MWKIIGLAVLVVVLSACSSVVVTPEQVRNNSRMNLFKPVPGKSVLYVYRDASLKEGYYASKLIINGYEVATGALNSFNVLILPPGEYVVGVTSSFQQGDYLPTDVTFKEGQVHYMQVRWQKDEGFRISAAVDTRAKKIISTGRLIAVKELCPDYSIDEEQKKQLGDSQVFFRPLKRGICTPSNP